MELDIVLNAVCGVGMSYGNHILPKSILLAVVFMVKWLQDIGSIIEDVGIEARFN
jgi:hypothetical protein